MDSLCDKDLQGTNSNRGRYRSICFTLIDACGISVVSFWYRAGISTAHKRSTHPTWPLSAQEREDKNERST